MSINRFWNVHGIVNTSGLLQCKLITYIYISLKITNNYNLGYITILYLIVLTILLECKTEKAEQLV